MTNSTTTAPQTPSQASQSHNVRKCPVLSGPTNRPEEIDTSPVMKTTCAQNPSHPDRTFTGHHPSSVPACSGREGEPKRLRQARALHLSGCQRCRKLTPPADGPIFATPVWVSVAAEAARLGRGASNTTSLKVGAGVRCPVRIARLLPSGHSKFTDFYSSTVPGF